MRSTRWEAQTAASALLRVLIRMSFLTASSPLFVCFSVQPLLSLSAWHSQEAWRAAASERARREMEGREAALRRQLAAERDEELAAVVARLEEDALAKEGQLQARLVVPEADGWLCPSAGLWRCWCRRTAVNSATLARLQKQLAAGEAAAEAKWREEVSRLRDTERSLTGGGPAAFTCAHLSIHAFCM